MKEVIWDMKQNLLTKRSLGNRITEHKADIKNKQTSVSVLQHMTERNHTAGFVNTKLFQKDNK